MMAPAASSAVPPGIEQDRVEEGFNQANVIHRAVRVHPGDILGQHRVAEAVNDVGELGDDRRIDLGVVGPENRLTRGCTLRANSSNTRCWYCISVPNLAAWKMRSPFHEQR